MKNLYCSGCMAAFRVCFSDIENLVILSMMMKWQTWKKQNSMWNTLVREAGMYLYSSSQEAYFYGMRFYVNEDVLIPRQDTEVLVEEVLKLSRTVFSEERRKALNILDVCTGSGCILLSLLSNLENATGTGVDLSEKALKVAETNGKNLEIPARWVHSNLFDKVQGTYDMIISNPPYIKTSVIEELMDEVKFHEPKMALDGKEDGLYFYREIIREAEQYLKEGGILAFEIGYDQGDCKPAYGKTGIQPGAGNSGFGRA